MWQAGVCAHTRSFAGHANISTAKKPTDQQRSLYREHSISHKHRNRCCATLLGSLRNINYFGLGTTSPLGQSQDEYGPS